MPHMKAAFDRLDQMTETFKGLGCKSMLYVGWRHDCHPWWYATFAPALGIKKIGIVEVFAPNASHAEQKAWAGEFGVDTVVIHKNVLTVYDEIKDGQYDVIFWDHGPEHVTLEQLKEVTQIMKRSCRLLLYSCPWGHWPQGADDGNEHERHTWDVTPDVFEEMGMLTSTVGESGQERGGEIIAWRCN